MSTKFLCFILSFRKLFPRVVFRIGMASAWNNSIAIQQQQQQQHSVGRIRERQSAGVEKITLSADVYFVCMTHALSTEKDEICGLLLGQVLASFFKIYN